MGLNTDMAPNFPVPSPYLQMTLPQPTPLSVPGIKGQWGSSASGPTYTGSQQKRKLEVQTWDLAVSATHPQQKSDTESWASF